MPFTKGATRTEEQKAKSAETRATNKTLKKERNDRIREKQRDKSEQGFICVGFEDEAGRHLGNSWLLHIPREGDDIILRATEKGERRRVKRVRRIIFFSDEKQEYLGSEIITIYLGPASYW